MIIDLLENIARTILDSTTIAIVFGALIAGYFGFNSYRNQKIWENIEERYFKKGIEALISYLQFLRVVIEDNFSKSLLVISYFRDLDSSSFLEWLSNSEIVKNKKSLSSKMPNSFLIVSTKLSNEHFNEVCMNIFAEIGKINDYFISDLIIGLTKVAKEPGSAKMSKNEIIEKLRLEGKKRYDHLNKELGLYDLILNLEKILFELRKMNINSYKKLDEAFKSSEVSIILKKLETIKTKEEALHKT